MRDLSATAAPLAATKHDYLESLPDEIERWRELVMDGMDRRDDTQVELLEALSVAWLAAERLRIEASPMSMALVNQH